MKNNWIVMAAATMMLTTACNKYEEGPALSLRSRTARVANAWIVEEALRDGVDVTEDYDQYELELLQDNDADLAAIYSIGDLSFEFDTDGTWMFEDSQETLKLDFDNDVADRSYLILKLREDELWLREIGGEDELHLAPQ